MKLEFIDLGNIGAAVACPLRTTGQKPFVSICCNVPHALAQMARREAT